MSGPEGWDGKSIRTHVEEVRGLAGEAIDLAQAACDEIARLRAELAKLGRQESDLPVSAFARHEIGCEDQD